MNSQLSVIALLLIAGPLYAADAVSARLQKGLFEEEANQNLDAAIAAYQSILSGHEEERKLAATALFRLGECYRKLGRTNEAAAQYQRLLRDFGEQSTLARLSEQNLFALGTPRDLGVQSGGPMRMPNPRERALIQEQIKIADQQLAEARKRIEQGVQSINADLPYQQALVRLRRELAATEEPAGGPQQRKWLQEEIKLAEQNVQRAKELINKGVAPVASELEPQKELLRLKRDLVVMETQPPGQSAVSNALTSFAERMRTDFQSGKADAERKEIQRLEALIKESPDLVNTFAGNQLPPLHTAVQSEQLEVAGFLLDHGADVDLKANGDSPLHAAVKRGNLAMVELLVRSKANLNARAVYDNAPLSLAAANGFKSIVELLLARGADVSAVNSGGQTPLHVAAAHNRKEIVEVLLANKADINASSSVAGTPLSEAVRASSLSIARLLLSKGAEVDRRAPDQDTPLVTAIDQRNESMVELLLAHRADPNTRFPAKGRYDVPDSPPSSSSGPSAFDVADFTPLMAAAYLGRTSIAQRLLKASADINARDAHGATALLWAVRRDRPETIELLLSAGADANIGTQYATPLGTAARFGRAEVARLLLDKGADANRAEFYSGPPLHSAVANFHKAVVELLLARGADISAADRNGETVLDVAKRQQDRVPNQSTIRAGINPPTVGGPELVELLRQHGANEYVPRAGLLTLCRVNRNFSRPIFFKGTNDYNQHTLVEFVLAAYSDGSGPEREFPDLTNLRISRRDPRDGKVRETKVDLEAILNSGDPTKDFPLQWGDIIEIPEVDHRNQDTWPGFSQSHEEAMRKFVTRRVEIIVKGETNRVTLPWEKPTAAGVAPAQGGGVGPLAAVNPGILRTTPDAGGFSASPVRNVRMTAGYAPFPGGAPALVGANWAWSTERLLRFRLRDALYNANVLRVSSDLSRVKVRRIDPATKKLRELQFDYASSRQPYEARTDLFLRDGDVVEVPEK